jgi:hypothetical protein
VSRYLEDLEEVAEDMARTLTVLRRYFMEIAEQHPEMDTGVIDGILARHRALKEQH